MNLKKSQREQLRMLFGGKCAYCGCELPEKGWHADHVEAVHREWWKTKEWREKHAIVYEYDKEKRACVARAARGDELRLKFERPQNDTMENLFPSCAPCNIDKHAMSLEDWRGTLERRVGVCRRNYSAFRHAERFGLVQEIAKPVVFHFETYVPPATPCSAESTET